ncbi:hypothetical protein LIER_09975 [Lithospermum erythrorhizon]|uniref:Reverse transcriptase domain-containing protein n=1 Tax=Lithospermum erythrorhizon TaxID=34254 RepID=A0AAV3PLX4_LITER
MPFGLKTAPSLVQKAMTKIFEPLLPNALIYIDDILLFSSDPSSHFELLLKFHDIVQSYGIMLSEKKIIIGEERIDFLGLHISEETFPDENLTFKQVQQFLGIVKYMADFIHNLTKYRSIQNATKWDEKCAEAVKELKQLTKTLLALQIPSPGKRILQTDAGDYFWGAVLLEEDGYDKRHICGYKSGAFKDSKKY